MLLELTQAEKVAKRINVIRKLEKDQELLQVREVFATLQGEGPHSGLPAVFIRLSGCHLACTFCDTVWDDENDKEMTPRELAEIAFCKWGQCMGSTALPLFVLTGGEPLRQDVTPFVHELFKFCPHALVQIETAGSFYREICADSRVQIVVSPKNSHVHPVTSRIAVAYKYVIRASDEFHPDTGTPIVAWTGENERPVALAQPPVHLQKTSIFLQPCDEGDPVKNRANLHKCYEISMKHGYRVGVQLHKIMDLP